jgi:hypothetical protein
MALRTDEWQQCKHCGKYVTVDIEILTSGPHYAKIVCSECGGYMGYQPKPKNEAKLLKRPNGCPTPTDLGIDYCQMCLRTRDKVKRKYLCVHHQDDDPTNNNRTNLQVVCVACHKLIAWVRAYSDND